MKREDYTQLSISPLDGENNLGALEDEELIGFVPSVFERDLYKIVARISDNLFTNKSLTGLVGCVFVGCAIHS